MSEPSPIEEGFQLIRSELRRARKEAARYRSRLREVERELAEMKAKVSP